ncbi:hypothetical protein BKA70DRAFT_1424032 [Coprinopsis sp. MPI-PUGE-AT-0042]|nr:hypothetical protein BKA70DRAFT_1424032 [Coprinopsis sp. MPI-PUGE-AT-0042]
MDTGPKLLPETVYQVIKLVEHSKWAARDVLTFLKNCVLVSKEWHGIARPLILDFLSIDLTEEAVARLATLHEILNFDRSYANKVHRLKIGIFDSGEGMESLKECGDSLLALVKRFTSLTHLLVDPSDGVCAWLCMESWWLHDLPAPAQEIFTHICALPSLQVLDLRGLELPPSVFIHYPVLQHLTLAYGVCSSQSLAILLHGVLDKGEVVDLKINTLRQMLKTHPQLFQSLTSFETLSLVENVQDIRAVLRATQGTLEHFACGLTWQRLDGPQYNPSHPPPHSEIENALKLDFNSMSRLSSIELRYDSPESLGFGLTSPAILSTLKTIRWESLKKFKLILAVDLRLRAPIMHESIYEYCNPLDALISQHTIASGTSIDHRLDDIQLWILYNSNGDPSKVSSGAEGRAFFPLLAEQASRRAEMKLGCHVWENRWHPEHEAYLIGGWKMRPEEEAESGVVG